MQVWEKFVQQQEIELGRETVQKWLRSLKILRFDACNLYLEAKDSFQALWFEEHIRAKAQAKLINGSNKSIKIHLLIANATPINKKERSQIKGNKGTKPAQFQLNFDELDPLCLFQHFVVCEENQITHTLLSELAGLTNTHTTSLGAIPPKKREHAERGASAGSVCDESVASATGKEQNESDEAPQPAGSRFSAGIAASLGAFNPIYLYGPTGSGKTHLLMSLAQSFLARGYKTLYVRAELFTDHVVSAIRAGEMSLFRQAYRNADILIIDDVHVFSRKGATQEEFFHTFNTLHLQGKQIILSANCAPQELQLIEPRLVSRFEWGIVLPLKPLDVKDIKNLLLAKSKALQFSLPPKIFEFLIETFTSNPKALIKAFEALVLRTHLDAHHSTQHLSLTTTKMMLSDLLAEEQKSVVTPPKIIQTIAEHYGIRSEDILGKSQTRECALPRQIAMHLCREKLKMPYVKIGDLFSRDHSTVMSSVKHIKKAIEEDNQEIVGAWNVIMKKLQT